jgi:hypothetical protein
MFKICECKEICIFIWLQIYTKYHKYHTIKNEFNEIDIHKELKKYLALVNLRPAGTSH